MPSVGETLKATRTQLRVQLKEVSHVTKIQPWVLEALETDQLHTMMSPVYVRGFLTKYAKLLHLDPLPLLDQLFPPPPPSPAPEAESVEPQAPKAQAPPLEVVGRLLEWAQPLLPRLKILVVGAAVVGLLLLVRPLRMVQSLQRFVSTKAPHQAASVSVVKPRSAPPPELNMELQPTQPLELSITARRATWVSVKADGRLLTQQQLAVGSKEIWRARKRMELIVATPASVEIALNGQSITPMALAHHGRLVITHTRIEPIPED